MIFFTWSVMNSKYFVIVKGNKIVMAMIAIYAKLELFSDSKYVPS